VLNDLLDRAHEQRREVGWVEDGIQRELLSGLLRSGVVEEDGFCSWIRTESLLLVANRRWNDL
jgi:hypothetical protein